MSRARLLLDEDIPLLLAQTLRARGLDAVHVVEQGLAGSRDVSVFEAALAERRTVLTHNVADFMEIVGSISSAGREHCGLLLAEQVEFRDLLARVARLLAERDAESLANAVVWLVR